MIAEVWNVNRVFAIHPGYRYFDDHGGRNALALPRTSGEIGGTRW